ncbi:MAG: ATP-binding cassette domain-containing protein [Candidatus Latescibacteria bacterium]|nr:ATP-binding cassette domain-containing protein [Candidatus Latescibacterota bacterium]NIM20950.1 ATP-binding cassette domain-containing protein [Candidatus Latescibacterota bacterium]NIM65085.1 ATP-binding cassette domain-containing protein [Candidatus Latescibacterota bacterium]NIO01600.1 ATP-binding cassette domain-containing protein [Candidatus Latescibacterota bacterium]NIO28117.1 ATP-binding cassette domain-containing protein [Candidatus Latescibacterota bacterium]
MDTDAVLLARGITKSFSGTGRKIEVLKGVDLSVRSGEVVMILGASGAGKTTLLNILGALDRPDSGTVLVQGSDLNRMRGGALDRLRNATIGFVFQFHFLLPEFTAVENVMMPRLIRGSSSQRARREAEDWLERVGLSERRFHKPPELSGGEQQRVAVARALINDPEVILADEPTGNLDDVTSATLHELINQLSASERKTFVIVTHKKEFAQFSRRTLLLENGLLNPM